MRRSPTTFLSRFPAAALLAILGGCTLTDQPASTRDAILPLAVGNSWSYVDSIYHDGALQGLDSARTAITGRRVVTAAGTRRTVYLSRSVDPVTGDTAPSALYVRNAADGNHTVGVTRDTAEFFLPHVHVPYPADTGTRSPVYFLDLREEDGTFLPVIDTLEIEVAATDTTCTTPAGTFACMEILGWRDADVLHARAWYAPGVGYLGAVTVRTQEIDGTEREVRRVRTLKSFHLQ